jgi:xanthine/uracil permease
VQTLRPVRRRLLIVQGTSFNFVGPLIAGGALMVKQGTPVEGVAAIFGVVIAGSFVEMGVSRILPFVKRLITPLVTGIVVLMIGLTLIKVGLISMGGGFGAMANGTFANGENLLLSGVVLAIIVVLNRIRWCGCAAAPSSSPWRSAMRWPVTWAAWTSPACTRPRCSRCRRRCTLAWASRGRCSFRCW